MKTKAEKRYIKVEEKKYRQWRRRDKTIEKVKFYVREAWRILSQLN